MEWERDGTLIGSSQQQSQEPGQVGKMSGNQNVPGFPAQPIAEPSRRVVRLQVTRGRKFSERVASAPERFRRLTRAQLAAVPDDRGPRAASRGGLRRSLHGLAALRREGAPRIDIRPDRVAVMNEKQVQSRGLYAVFTCLWHVVSGNRTVRVRLRAREERAPAM